MNQWQWLVEFKPGVGFTFDLFEDAQRCAAEAVLERALEVMKTDDQAKHVLDWLALGKFGEAIKLWNSLWVPITVRQIEKSRILPEDGSLQVRAQEALKLPKPSPKMSLLSAIKHASHQAEVATDPKAEQDHQQLASWLQDLLVLQREVSDWAYYANSARIPEAHEEALLEVLQDLKGHYDGE